MLSPAARAAPRERIGARGIIHLGRDTSGRALALFEEENALADAGLGA
jgi:hypothetical protein